MADGETGLIVGDDGVNRCFWCGDKPDYVAYHDAEWGMPQDDEHRLFEKICLEGFQSGLSWLTILRKRDNFRAAFDGFDFAKVANYGDAEIERLVNDAGIVRHRGKIVSTINNANRALEMVEAEGSLGAWFWGWAEQARADRPAQMDAESLMALGFTDDVHRHVEGVEEARLVLRRADHLLRLHAGHGVRERPYRRLRRAGDRRRRRRMRS